MSAILSHRPAIHAMRSYVFRRRFLGFHALPNVVIAAIPILIASVAAVHGVGDPYELYGEYILPICIYFALPFMCMFTVLPILGELYDNTSIGYFYTRPTPRWVSLLGILQGSLLALLPILLIAAIVPGILLMLADDNSAEHDWLARIGGLSAVLILGAAPYSALCLLLGVWFKKAILWAALFLLGWGAFFGALPGSIRFTSPHRYLIGLTRDWCQIENTWTGMFAPDPSPPTVYTSLMVIAISSLAFFWLAGRSATKRDVL